MWLYGIIINQTNAQIGIDRSPVSLNIQSQSAKLNIKQNQGKINIHSEKPKVVIDQKAAFSSAGLKSVFEQIKDAAQNGYQQYLEYISKTVSDGHMLASIEKGGNPIVSIAKRDSARPEHEFGIANIPKVGPQIDVKGYIQIEPEMHENNVETDYLKGSLDINYTPSKVNIYLKQYNSINTSYQPGGIIDKQL